MQLKTLKFCPIINANISVKPLDNNNSIITSSVRLTAKYKQNAQNRKQQIENEYNNSIDKGITKRNFYNKHKK